MESNVSFSLMSFVQLPNKLLSRAILTLRNCVIILICFTTLLFPVTANAEPANKNVILIGIDTLRTDHVSSYGYYRATTPNIDMMGRQGFVFNNCSTVSPWTLPSFFSMLTSTYPSTHLYGTNIRGFVEPVSRNVDLWTVGTISPDYGIRTLAEILREHDYSTAAFVNNPFLKREYEMDRGFDKYTQYGPTAREGIDQVLQWIEQHREENFFLFIHFMEPHDYYIERAPINELLKDFSGPDDKGLQVELNKYDASIYFCDREVGRIREYLKQLDLDDETVVIVTSDHGEEFFEHGKKGHGQSLYNEVLSVPLFIYVPWIKPADTALTCPVTTLDIAPTILEIVNVPLSPYFKGMSLVPALKGQAVPDRPFFAEALLYGDQKKGVLFNNYKLIYTTTTNEFELYDLQYDSRDTSNLVGRDSSVDRQMKQMLQSHLSRADAEMGFALQSHPELEAVSVTLTTPGVFVNVMPFNLTKPQPFKISESRKEIRTILGGTPVGGGISFHVQPPNAPIQLDLKQNMNKSSVGVYLGSSFEDAKIPPIIFDRKMLRNLGLPLEDGGAGQGIHLWLRGEGREAKPVVIDEAAKKALEALGYLK